MQRNHLTKGLWALTALLVILTYVLLNSAFASWWPAGGTMGETAVVLEADKARGDRFFTGAAVSGLGALVFGIVAFRRFRRESEPGPPTDSPPRP